MWVGVGGRNVLGSYLRVGVWVSEGEMCWPRTCVWVGVGRRNVLASYLSVGGCWEEYVLASYLHVHVGGCREECVSPVPACGWVSVGEMC